MDNHREYIEKVIKLIVKVKYMNITKTKTDLIKKTDQLQQK
jgi:hypothetical protein